jgi:hypothetical protein
LKRRVFCFAFVAVGPPARANAHAMLEGAGGFYAGLLHPLVVPAEALAIVAIALMLSSSGRAACWAGLPAFAVGLAAGLVFGRLVSPAVATFALVAIAFLAAALVTAGLHLPPAAAALVAALAGAAVGVDAQPETVSFRQAVVSGTASILGATTAALIVAGFLLGREHGWQGIAQRVAGSWITASAILYFAWLVSSTLA